MHCPKCRSENPDDTQICESCSFALTSQNTQQSKQKTYRIIRSVCPVILVGLAAILTFFLKPTLAFIAAAFALYSTIASIPEFARRESKRKARRITIAIGTAVLILSSLMMLILNYLRLDAAPIGNDYTIKDIKSAAPECNQTYNLLYSLVTEDKNVKGAPAIGLSAEEIGKLEEINNILKDSNLQTISQQLEENEEDILLIWENAEKGRDILAKLDSFPEIADLQEPGLQTVVPFLANIRRLAFLHRYYICLQSCKGNHEDAINELTRFDSIFRKMNLNARWIITKLVCIACFNIDIQTANFIINNPETPQESLLVLEQHIVPFSGEHTSLRNCAIFGYLAFKNEITKISNELRLRSRYSNFSPLKLNSALRLYKNISDEWIAIEENKTKTRELRVWPTLYPNLPVRIDSEGKLAWYYKIYNPVGTLTIEMLTPAIERLTEIRKNFEIHSDLLQIVLDKRLGEEVSLKARAYSDEYIVDVEGKKIFSPGPDGEAGTKDDTKLAINPDVLGWQKQQ
ncbi:MAG: hypothetical protein ACYTBX_09845 [Planctomycetota bacterium]